MARRRIGADISEVQVEGDQNATFVSTRAQDSLIRSAAELLFKGCRDIVAGVAEERDHLAWNVLV